MLTRIVSSTTSLTFPLVTCRHCMTPARRSWSHSATVHLQQSAAIRATISLIKLRHRRLVKNSWKQPTLCCAIVRHEETSGRAPNSDSTPCLWHRRLLLPSNSRIIQVRGGYANRSCARSAPKRREDDGRQAAFQYVSAGAGATGLIDALSCTISR